MHLDVSGYIYRHAMKFYNLALPALEDDSQLVKCDVAIACNLALCVELLLKSVAPKRDNQQVMGEEIQVLENAEIASTIKGGSHGLKSLYDRLPIPVSDFLAKLYQEETSRTLIDDLEVCKDYFVHARYAYGPNSMHPYRLGDIQILANGLSKSIQKGGGMLPSQ